MTIWEPWTTKSRQQGIQPQSHSARKVLILDTYFWNPSLVRTVPCVYLCTPSPKRDYKVWIFQAKVELVNSIQLLYNVQEKRRNVLRRHGFHFFFIPFSSVYTGYQNKGDHYGISIQVCNSALNLYTWLCYFYYFCSIPFSQFSNSSSSSYFQKDTGFKAKHQNKTDQ